MSEMVEVFKTNVCDREQAAWLLDRIHKMFCDYSANFDLEDCDRILRVRCRRGAIQSGRIIELVKESGFDAAVLEDEHDWENVHSKQRA